MPRNGGYTHTFYTYSHTVLYYSLCSKKYSWLELVQYQYNYDEIIMNSIKIKIPSHKIMIRSTHSILSWRNIFICIRRRQKRRIENFEGNARNIWIVEEVKILNSETKRRQIPLLVAFSISVQITYDFKKLCTVCCKKHTSPLTFFCGDTSFVPGSIHQSHFSFLEKKECSVGQALSNWYASYVMNWIA